MKNTWWIEYVTFPLFRGKWRCFLAGATGWSSWNFMVIKVGSMTIQLYLEICVCFFWRKYIYTIYYIYMLGILNDINTNT